MRAVPPALLISLALAVTSAGAQDAAPPADDAIGALLQDQTTDIDAVPPATASYARPAAPPRKPIPQLDRPVMIGEVGRAPDGPPDAIELGYDSRLRSSFQSAQGLQGPLDGGWTVRAHDGAGLFGFQLVDRGYGYPTEGAWRALDSGGKIGLIDSLDRQPTVLTIRITRGYGKPTTVLTLSQTSDGGWVGNLTDEAGARPITMRRN